MAWGTAGEMPPKGAVKLTLTGQDQAQFSLEMEDAAD